MSKSILIIGEKWCLNGDEYIKILENSGHHIIRLEDESLSTSMFAIQTIRAVEEVHIMSIKDESFICFISGIAFALGKRIKTVNFLFSNSESKVLELIDNYSQLVWSVEGDGELVYFSDHSKELALNHMVKSIIHSNKVKIWNIYAEDPNGFIYSEQYNGEGLKISTGGKPTWSKFTIKEEGVN